MLYFILLWLASALGWFLLSALITIFSQSAVIVIRATSATGFGLLTALFITSLRTIIFWGDGR